MADNSEEVQRATREALAALDHRKVSTICPRCSHAGWNVELTGLLAMPMLSDGQAVFSIPPPFFPTLVLTCTTCGFLSAHNLKTLGVAMPQSPKPPEAKR